jgi:cytochrome c
MGARVENSRPVVKISAPAKGTQFSWGAMVSYKISVEDKEDGNSAYDEIVANKVFLSVRYVADSTKVKKNLDTELRASQDVLIALGATTCFNCHQMKTKLIGPSFEAIAQKYPNNDGSVQALLKKVISGTVGTWGEVQMPAHPELSVEGAQQMVKWILKNGGDANQNHLAGIAGTFRVREKRTGDTGKAVCVITATYGDSEGKIGQHTVVCAIH